MSIVLKVISGPSSGKEFVFDEPDIFLFGRDLECHYCLTDDKLVSRHHFMLNIDPPFIHLMDLGSLNGTYVNNEKIGGRDSQEPVNIDIAKQRAQSKQLYNNDIIKVGKTEIKVFIQPDSIEVSEDEKSSSINKIENILTSKNGDICYQCNNQIQNDEDFYTIMGGKVLCNECRTKLGTNFGIIKDQYEDNHIHLKNKNQKYNNVNNYFESLFSKKSNGQVVLPQIEGYDFLSELGRGGFGRVYLVNRVKDNKKLALKLMIANKKQVKQREKDLFQQEMENCRSLRHINIVGFEDYGFFDDLAYFTMEYCGGGCMGEFLTKNNGCLELEKALVYMVQVLDALEFIHNNKFVHRDLKPDNILLDESFKYAKIADLGLAKSLRKSVVNIPINFAGTPHYMPKEQVTHYKVLNAASDVFSIGATFYKMLTGEYVYDFTGCKDPMQAIMSGKTIPINNRKWMIPKSIADVIDKSISVEVKDRYKNASEMKIALHKAI